MENIKEKIIDDIIKKNTGNIDIYRSKQLNGY